MAETTTIDSPNLYVFHPSTYVVGAIDSLLAPFDSDIRYENIVLEDLLDRAMVEGITKELVDRVKSTISQIPQIPKSVILCSCSTFGGCVESMQEFTSNSIIRIDRPMAELAIATGSSIGVAAALESTLAPTTELLQSVADAGGKKVSIKEILCESAWASRQANDLDGYISEIVKQLERTASQFDVIVLAQASMASAAVRLGHLDTPILSSPELGIERVVQMCRNLAG